LGITVGLTLFNLFQRKSLVKHEKDLIKQAHVSIQSLDRTKEYQHGLEPYLSEPYLTGLMDIGSEIDRLEVRKKR